VNPDDLANEKKLVVRYRDAKLQFHMKMAVIPKFKKNIEIFKGLTKEEPHLNLKRTLRSIYYDLIAASNRRALGDILEALGITVRAIDLPPDDKDIWLQLQLMRIFSCI
jgi:hypothetical protein